MADWLVEEGIAEHRAIRVADDRIVAALVQWPGELSPGAVVAATLVSRSAGASRGTVRLPDGSEALIDRLPSNASEGAAVAVEITRSAMPEPGRRKRALARPSEAEPALPPSLAERLAAAGHVVKVVPRFPVAEWPDLIADAFAGEVAFAGGSLILSPTPAMTLIDIDGALPPFALAQAAIPAIAEALPRFGIGGSVGIDFPTLNAKTERKAIDAALGDALADWPHERTAMNGFGFVQLVARSRGPSLLQRARWQGSATAARALLRRAETVDQPGTILLNAHPAVLDRIDPAWLFDLARRTGREARLAPDAKLALSAGFAQAVTR